MVALKYRDETEAIEVLVQDCSYGFSARAFCNGLPMYGFHTTKLHATPQEAEAEVNTMLRNREEARHG